MLVPSKIVKFDVTTHQFVKPVLKLWTLGGKFLGTIPYTDLKFSFVGKGVDEISFTVHKYTNGKKCSVWDELKSLKIIEYPDYACFLSSFTDSDSDENTKQCVAKSLECELGQRILYELDINNEDDILRDDYEGATVLYNKDNPQCSLLNRVLADKAPHWTIGEVDSQFFIGGKIESANTIQREFTVDGTSIYDFLEGDVSEQFGCVFVYDTTMNQETGKPNRIIHCKNLDEGIIDKNTNEVISGAYSQDGICYDANGDVLDSQNIIHCYGYGTDTNILITKNRLVNNLSRDEDSDSVKNCFKVSGGDDMINSYVRVANATGTDYIYLFDDFQYEDMSSELSNKLQSYQTNLEEKRKEYTSENGLFLKYCNAVDNLSNLEHNMFPDTSITIPSVENANQQIIDYFNSNNVYVQNEATTSSFDNVTRTVEQAINVVCNTAYTFEMINTNNNMPTINGDLNSETGTVTFTCSYNLYRTAYPNDTDKRLDGEKIFISVTYYDNSDNGDSDIGIAYSEQMISIAVAKSDVAELDFTGLNYNNKKVYKALQTARKAYRNNPNDSELETAWNNARIAYQDSMIPRLEEFFGDYNLTSLNSYVKAIDSCVSSIDQQIRNSQNTDVSQSESLEDLRDNWVARLRAVKSVASIREEEVEKAQGDIDSLSAKIQEFQNQLNLQNYLGNELWAEFNSFVREDEYNNQNFTSDAAETDSEILSRATMLLEYATDELKKSCVLQNTISGDINNIFSIQELDALHDKFALFNFLRCKLDDRIYKLRLIEMSFDENSPEKLDVTFSEQVEDVTGKVSDIESILNSAASISTSYPSTMLQASKGAIAQSTFNSLYQEGLDSSLIVLKNSTDEEVVMDKSGILLRSQNDIGSYGLHQARLVGNGLYLTDNGWNTIRSALGLMKVNGQWCYGLIADAVIGKFICGEKLSISNSNGSVYITGDGITLTNGKITWSKDGTDGINSPFVNDIPGLTDHLDQLDGRIQTYNQTTDPRNNKKPTYSEDWGDDADHIGDLWTNPSTGITKQFVLNSSTYEWVEVTDSYLESLAKSKAQIFTSRPTVPYFDGDMIIPNNDFTVDNVTYVAKKGYRALRNSTNSSDGKSCVFSNSDWDTLDYTNDDSLNDFIEGKYADTLEDVKKQIDGKSDTYYQSTKPHEEYKNISSNEKYDLYVGDLWYDTNNGISYMYTKKSNNTNTSKYDYTWEVMDIPDSVYDKIDGKKSIYTSLPSSYNVNDMYVLEQTRDNFKKGSILIAQNSKENQTSFLPSDWSESVKYTDDTKIDNFKNNIDAALGATIPTNEIGSDYIISPKIGGGYLYVLGNSGSVEINPELITGYTGRSGNIFNIKNSSNDSVFNIDTSGQVNISGGTSSNSIQLKGSSGAIISQTSNRKAVITNGSVYLSKDNTDYVTLHTVNWASEPTVYGVGINSESDSKFISFGNKNDSSDETYITPLVLNYGLNPNGDTQDVLVYGTSYFSDNIYNSMNGYLGTSGCDWYCSTNFITQGALWANNTMYHNYYIGAPNGYIDGDFRICGIGSIGLVQSVDLGLWDSTTTARHTAQYSWDGNNFCLYIDAASNPTWWYASGSFSDKRVKTNINQLKSVKDFYLELQPSSYEYTENNICNYNGVHYGLIAQDVQSLLDKYGYSKDSKIVQENPTDLGTKDWVGSDTIYSIKYEELHAYHIAFGQEIYKELTEKIKQLENRIKGLEQN